MNKWLLGDLLVKHKIALNKTEVQTLCCLYVKHTERHIICEVIAVIMKGEMSDRNPK